MVFIIKMPIHILTTKVSIDKMATARSLRMKCPLKRIGWVLASPTLVAAPRLVRKTQNATLGASIMKIRCAISSNPTKSQRTEATWLIA